ncbi:response regulator transcription factor [Ruania albidiflava]|uniref:response regulator transcription factor n=1 Tax=Ruania albidiflava TaxID=366586 RepID=UPI0023F585DF|nr:response regulator transcription factor [Ruania albidiflava]
MNTSSTVVLVVEDEPEIATQIARRLEAEGWQAHTVGDGLAGVSAAARLLPDLIVLDVMLPGIDGLEACRRIQAEATSAGRHVPPIMMLTARDDETDMLVGLGVGADDYMTKPFSMRELLARLKVLLRRVERSQAAPAGSGEAPLQLGDLTIDKAARRVRRAEEEAHLTPTEFDLLVCLASSPRTVLSRERLLAEVWDWADASGTRTVDSHIKALRRKLGSDLIRTVHGVGYALEPTQ